MIKGTNGEKPGVKNNNNKKKLYFDQLVKKYLRLYFPNKKYIRERLEKRVYVDLQFN